jgi:hypothetical protein
LDVHSRHSAARFASRRGELVCDGGGSSLRRLSR